MTARMGRPSTRRLTSRTLCRTWSGRISIHGSKLEWRTEFCDAADASGTHPSAAGASTDCNQARRETLMPATLVARGERPGWRAGLERRAVLPVGPSRPARAALRAAHVPTPPGKPGSHLGADFKSPSGAPAWNAGFSRHSPPQAGGGTDLTRRMERPPAQSHPARMAPTSPRCPEATVARTAWNAGLRIRPAPGSAGPRKRPIAGLPHRARPGMPRLRRRRKPNLSPLVSRPAAMRPLQNHRSSASCGVTAGIGDRAKSRTFLVTMCCAPQARAAATCKASSKSAIGRETA